MKGNVFGLAIGIAAIDALLSSFVAILLLALVLISTMESSSTSGEALRTYGFVIRKTAPNGAPMSERLLLDIGGGAGGHLVPMLSLGAGSTHVEGPSDLLASGGGIWWYDCTTSGQECDSTLVVVRPKGDWVLRLRVASSIEGENVVAMSTLHLSAHLVGGTDSAVVQKDLITGDQVLLCPHWKNLNSQSSC